MAKKDKGFDLFYWNLSYRRKLIRSIWLTPLTIFVPLYVYFRMKSVYIAIIVAVVLALVDIAQISYNYRKWKSDEN